MTDRIPPIGPVGGANGVGGGAVIPSVTRANADDRRGQERRSADRRAKKESASTLTKKLATPDILPEDLNKKRSFSLFDRPAPRRRSQLAREELQIEAS